MGGSALRNLRQRPDGGDLRVQMGSHPYGQHLRVLRPHVVGRSTYGGYPYIAGQILQAYLDTCIGESPE
ncbi:hypothetical protein SDC9_190713 [bioreactor metagenome]|uniref:Uncharacterized protein n=1 Tax=bioreactor metagenome TaxID=1076179 RepID=A0A645I413_9ZZZZ